MVSVRIQIVSRLIPHYGDTVSAPPYLTYSAQRLSIVVQGLVSVAHGRSCVARVGTGLAKVRGNEGAAGSLIANDSVEVPMNAMHETTEQE